MGMLMAHQEYIVAFYQLGHSNNKGGADHSAPPLLYGDVINLIFYFLF